MGMTMKLSLGDTYFEIQDDLLIRCRGTAAIRELPEKVRRIGKGAFRDCLSEEVDLTHSKIRFIDDEAFYLNTSLKKVSLPELDRIGSDAFRDCENLETVRFLGSIGEIEEQAFMGCRSLKEIELPSAGKIGRWCFMNCEEIRTVHFNGPVEEIAAEAFFCCRHLKEIRFSEVGKMGECVFFECKELETVHFTGPVTEIGEEAFRNCLSLKKLIFDDKVESIGLGAFSYCRNLTDVVIAKDTIEPDDLDSGFWTTSFTKSGGLEQHPEGNAPWYQIWKIGEIDQKIAAEGQEHYYISKGKCPFCGGDLIAKRERLFRPKKTHCVRCGRKEEEIKAFTADYNELRRKRLELTETAGENPAFAALLLEYEKNSREKAGRKPK